MAWLLVGAVLDRGQRTVTSWIRAAQSPGSAEQEIAAAAEPLLSLAA